MTIQNRKQIIEAVTDDIYQAYPDLIERYGEYGRRKTLEDNEHHLKHLETSVSLGNPQFFIDYAQWLDGILTARGMTTALLIDNFERLLNIFSSQDDIPEEYINILSKTIEFLNSKSQNPE